MPYPPRYRANAPSGRRIFFVEDRYLPPDWHGRTEDTEGLIQIRTQLIDAYRRGRIRPADVDAVSARVEWIDARIGRLARERIEQRRAEAAARLQGTAIIVLMLIVAAVVLVAFGAPRAVLTVCGVALLVAVVTLAASIRPPATLAEEDEPGRETYLAEL